MAKITDEQKKRLLELALLSYLNKKQSNIFKDYLKPTPRPRPRPGAVDLTKTCPNCGSQNILEPNRDFNLKWECVKCRAEFDAPVWGKTTDRRWKISSSAIPDTQQTIKVKRTQYLAARMQKRARRAKVLAAQEAATLDRHNNLIADRVRDSTKPVCPNCGKFSYSRYETRSNEKIQYKCRSCGFIFDQPLKPGKVTAPRVSCNIKDWRAKYKAMQAEKVLTRREQKIAKAAARRAHEAEKKAQRSATWQAYKARRWEQKFAESKARWHEKFDRDMLREKAEQIRNDS